MTFDEKLNELISEVEVPDELSPENIAKMLKAQKASSVSSESEKNRNIKLSPTIAAQRRTIIIRTSAAVAACAVFAAGMLTFNEHNKEAEQIDEQISYAAVSPDSYTELYNIYTGIYLDGTESDAPDAGDTDISAPTQTIYLAPDEPEETLGSSFDFSDINDPRVSRADIVKSDGTNLYCITDNKLYIVFLETMEVTAEIENKLNPPVELYISGNKLILMSKENEEITVVDTPADTAVQESSETYSNRSDAAVCRTNVVVDIYNISDKTNPVHTTTYKQNGSYTSSRIVDGILYTVTGYCNYRNKPLDKDADLDSFVPAYYINGEKKYIAAGDITVPANANSTDYTVVSAIDIESGAQSAVVKAVLGNSKNVYCSADTLYIVGVGKSKENTDYSIITSFDLSGSGMTYKTSSSVAGKVIPSMNEYNGLFRMATRIVDEDGIMSTAIYALDETLTVVNSAGQLMEGHNITAVRFEESFASLYVNNDSEPAMVIDISSNPPVQAQALEGSSAYLCGFSSDKLIGINKEETGLSVAMYSSENGLMYDTAAFAEDCADADSAAFTDTRAVLADTERSVIGIPVYSHNEFGTRNQYFVFEYKDDSFILKGSVEYNDIDDSGIFKRAVIEGDILYIISDTRIVSVQLDDMKVIGALEF